MITILVIQINALLSGGKMKRIRAAVRGMVAQASVATALLCSASAQDTQYEPKEQQIPPPKCLMYH